MFPVLQPKTKYQLNGYVSNTNYWQKWVKSTNIQDLNLLYFSLIKKGFGSLKEVMEFDTDIIYEILEYESIINDIEQLEYNEMKEERN